LGRGLCSDASGSMAGPMRVMAVMLGVLGGVCLSAPGQGDVRVGELSLHLTWPESKGVWKPAGIDLRRELRPMVVMRRTADGSVRSRYALHVGWTRGMLLEEGDVEMLLASLGAFVNDEREGVEGHRGDRFGDVESSWKVPVARQALRLMHRDSAQRVILMIGETRKRAKAFMGADFQLKRDAIRKLEGPVIDGWSISMHIGSVEMPEFGGTQWVWWQGWCTTSRSEPGYGLDVRPQEGAVPGPRPWRISAGFLEELGRVPGQLARGKTVRWKGEGEMLRAFAENRAIFYRPDTRKQEDVRISLETAQEAWKILEKRDRMAEWFAKDVEPGLKVLMTRGRE